MCELWWSWTGYGEECLVVVMVVDGCMGVEAGTWKGVREGGGECCKKR